MICLADMKLLKAPYGHHGEGAYVSIQLRVTGNLGNKDEVREILRAFGCYNVSEDKIYNCLFHSGFYECHVQAGWIITKSGMLRYYLAQVGISLAITGSWKICDNLYEQCLESLDTIPTPYSFFKFTKMIKDVLKNETLRFFTDSYLVYLKENRDTLNFEVK